MDPRSYGTAAHPRPEHPQRPEQPPPPVHFPIAGHPMTLRVAETLVPAPQLRQATTGSAAGGGVFSFGRTTSQATTPVADRHDVGSVAVQHLAIAAPTRPLPARKPCEGDGMRHAAAWLDSAAANRASKAAACDSEVISGASCAGPDTRPLGDILDAGDHLLATCHPGLYALWNITPHLTPSAAPSEAGGRHRGEESVQLYTVAFSSRCTAFCTFTTHPDAEVATGRRPPLPPRSTGEGSSALGSSSSHHSGAERSAISAGLPVGTDGASGPGTPRRRAGAGAPGAELPPVQIEAASEAGSRADSGHAASDAKADHLWSAFGFVDGDIVVWSHTWHRQLKRLNTARIAPRPVPDTPVSAIVRVPREVEAAPAACNDHTVVFGELVVGFDNGSIAVVMLNATGGFIEDDRTAWLGFFPIHVIAPCPAAPSLLALGCGDGAVRFVETPFFTDRRASGVLTTGVPTVDVGTDRDPRLLAVAPEAAPSGGVTTLVWREGSGGVYAAGHDDSVSFVAVDVTPRGVSTPLSHTSSPQRAAAVVHDSPPLEVQPPPAAASPLSFGAAGQQMSVCVRGAVHRRFHRSWIAGLAAVPVSFGGLEECSTPPADTSVASCDGAPESPGLSPSAKAPPATSATLLLAASEDGRVSVWPLPTDAVEERAEPSRLTASRRFTGHRLTPALRVSQSAHFPGGASVAAAALPRNPAAVLPRVVRHISRQVPTATGGRVTRDSVLLDDFVCAVVPLPHGAPGDDPRAARRLSFAAVTVKGRCFLWEGLLAEPEPGPPSHRGPTP